MSNSDIMEFNRAKSLLVKGYYEQALQIVNTLEEKAVLSDHDRFICHIIKVKLLIRLGNSDVALKLSKELLNKLKSISDPILIFEILIAVVEVLWNVGKYDEGLEKIKQAELVLESLDQDKAYENILRRAALDHNKGLIYYLKGDFEKALQFTMQGLKLREPLDNKQDTAESLKNLGFICLDRGELNRALEYSQRGLMLFEQIEDKLGIAKSNHNIAMVYWYKGDLNKALEYSHQALTFFEQVGNKRNIAASLNNIGIYYLQKGELNQALDYYKKALVVRKELGNKMDISGSLNNIGFIYQQKGELNRALNYLQRSLTFIEEIGNDPEIAIRLQTIGSIYRSKGILNRALEYCQKSLEIYERIGNSHFIARALLDLIIIATDKPSIDVALKYLQKLRAINETEETKAIAQQYRFAKALCLKTEDIDTENLNFENLRTVLSKYLTAQQMFRYIIREEIIDYNLTVEAIFNLCELLILDLKIFRTEAVITEVNQLSYRLFQIAQSQNSFSLLAKTYLLQANLALLEPNFDRAHKMLSHARQIAEVKGYERLNMVIISEQKRLVGKLPNWLYDQDINLLERLRHMNLDELIAALRQNRVEDYVPKENQIRTLSEDERKSFGDELGKRVIEGGSPL